MAETKDRRGSSSSSSSSEEEEEEVRSMGMAEERRLDESKKKRSSSSSSSARSSHVMVSVFRRSMSVHLRRNEGLLRWFLLLFRGLGARMLKVRKTREAGEMGDRYIMDFWEA